MTVRYSSSTTFQMISNIKAKQPIIRISHITEPTEVGVLWVLARQFSALLSQLLDCLPVPSPLGAGNGIFNAMVGRIFSPAFPSIVSRHEDCFYKLVQF